jgi:hypothetical protein
MNRETQSHVAAEELHLIFCRAANPGVIEESRRT